jgi:hypothetical protein
LRGNDRPQSGYHTVRMPFVTEHPDVPGWRFTITEISNNVYRVDGRDAAGRSISRTGHKEDELMRDCIQDAIEVSNRPPKS